MSKVVKTILLIENKQDDFTAVKSALIQHFGDAIQVLPREVENDGNTFEHNNFLLDKMHTKDFGSVVDYYDKCDLFIVDVRLRDNRDTLGLDFCKFVLSQHNYQRKMILTSNNDLRNLAPKHNNVLFVSKFEYGITEFPEKIAEYVQELLDIPKSSVGVDGPLFVVPSAHKKKDWEKLRAHINFCVDIIVYSSFYVLIALSTLYAAKGIIVDLYKTAFGDRSDEAIYEKSILTTAEHIFLYILPTFIVFSFFHYYRNSLRVALLEGTTEEVIEEKSTRTMNLTKILFVSSIISYVLIKVIEEIFFSQTTEIVRLTSFGLLLLLLMTYFVFLNWRNH